MIESQAQPHRVAKNNRPAFALGRYTEDGSDAENRRLGIVDNGRERLDVETAQAGDGEVSALQVFRRDPARAGAFDQ